MAGVERPGTDLEQQRGHQEEVVPAHEDDLDVPPALAKPLQVAGRAHPTEAAAEDHNPGLHVVSQGMKKEFTRRTRSADTPAPTARPRPGRGVLRGPSAAPPRPAAPPGRPPSRPPGPPPGRPAGPAAASRTGRSAPGNARPAPARRPASSRRSPAAPPTRPRRARPPGR